MNSIKQRRERRPRFTLGRATVLALVLHVLFGAAVTYWPGLLSPAELMATPERPPLQFNFVDTPETEPPPEPPDTEVLSDVDRRAADAAEPTADRTPVSEGNTPAQVIRPAPTLSEASETVDTSESSEQPPLEGDPAEDAPAETETQPAEPETNTDAAAETPTTSPTAEPTPRRLPPRPNDLRRSLARPESFVDPQIYSNREGGAGGDRAMAQFDTKGYDLGTYLNTVLRRIEGHWRSNMPTLIQTGIGGATFVALTIRRERNADGEEVAIIVGDYTWSSGQPAYDSAAGFAIELSNALPPIPGFFPHDTITGRLGFIYNLDPDRVVFPEDR